MEVFAGVFISYKRKFFFNIHCYYADGARPKIISEPGIEIPGILLGFQPAYRIVFLMHATHVVRISLDRTLST
jgi:hypothetical protein